MNRSQDEDSLSDQNASKTTAFFIGGSSFDDWKIENGKIRVGDKLRARLEDFLSRGGRVVLVDPRWNLKSESQGWEVRNQWDSTPQESVQPGYLPLLRRCRKARK